EEDRQRMDPPGRAEQRAERQGIERRPLVPLEMGVDPQGEQEGQRGEQEQRGVRPVGGEPLIEEEGGAERQVVPRGERLASPEGPAGERPNREDQRRDQD